ncbi:ImpA family metalloprotease, partial [Pseudoalteromonas sp.]|uniref:ImpA family metalloprotease n=1 Tax=Pseudoalteromonas sp. TaxID=53249 RepID=UPI0035699655
NLPSWASFSTINGEISGTPSANDIGTFENIEITVSDTQASSSITVSITVNKAPITNTPPVISGTPADAEENKPYSFIPAASDADGDTLRFSVKNLPSWANFNTINGEVSGTPTANDIGIFENIEVTVSDTHAASSITVSITVNKAPITNTPPEISGMPKNAIVGIPYEFLPTVKDNDDDKLTFSTSNLPTWLSLDANTGKLSGTAKNEHVGTFDNIILTVSDGKAENTLTFSVTVDAANNLPVLVTALATARADESFSLQLQVKDDDNDSVEITPLNLPHWLSFNTSSLVLSGTPKDDNVGNRKLEFTLSDGKETNSQSLILTTEKSWLTIAIETGNALVVKESDTILNAAINELSSHKVRFNDIKSQLFKKNSQGDVLDAIDWDPTHDAAILQGQYPFNDNVLYTTSSNQSGGPDRVLPIAIAGSKTPTSGRYIAYGGNPFRNSVNDQMLKFMTNTFDWLTQSNTTIKSQFNVVLSQLDESYWFRDRSLTRAWLDANYSNVSYNQAGDCDGSKLAECIAAKPDVIIISRMLRDGDNQQAILDAVSSALNQNIPVLYIQYDGGIGEHGRKLLQLLNISHKNDNYWWKLYLDDFNPSTVFNKLPNDMQAINTLLNNFKTGVFNVDLSNCETRSCPDNSNSYNEFFAGADVVKTMFNGFDSEKRNIFKSADYRLNKLLILLADHYRQTVSFPMDKIATDTVSFFKSLYADYAVYNVRDINPTQPDMGNFSRSDFSHITPEHAAITLTAKPYFRSAGVYAIPGQSFTVTRTDNQAVTTHIFINTLRTGATHIFSENKYNRPYLLQTQKIEVKPNESVTLTSSYGGPIQIAFDKKDLEVNFSFTHVGRHPHWRNKDDDAIFAERMASGDYDWAEIATPGFEVHSKLSKLEASLAGSIWPVASDFANATSRYTHNLVHVLAGFKGPGIDVEPEIHDFVTARGLEVDTIDIVKHMNADQPTCGWGCSGNPYDAGWNFSPTGHGDLHELGHGIERSSMRFEGYGGHSNTNFYSYFSKSIYEDDTGESASCQSLPFETLFNTLQQSKLEADSIAYMQANLTKGWSEHHAIYLQLMMAAQAENTLNNGWFLYPRLHIWEREFYRADDSDSAWEAKKSGLGFSNYSRAELSSISRNDWLYISLSNITQLDLTTWFTMYGFTVSDTAKTQVKSNGFKEIAEVFYTSTGTGYCSSLVQSSVPVDGKQVWPHN